jgi:hypothetical protein
MTHRISILHLDYYISTIKWVCQYQYQNVNSFVILEYYSFQLVSYQYFSRSILISKSSTLLVIFFISCLNCNGEVTKHILNDHGNYANWLKIMNGSLLCITAYPSGTLKFILVFSGARVAQSSVFLALTIVLLNIVFRRLVYYALPILWIVHFWLPLQYFLMFIEVHPTVFWNHITGTLNVIGCRCPSLI